MRAILTIFFLSLFTSQAQPPMFKMLVKRQGGCSYVLDQYGGAKAAYSLMKIRSDYSGNSIRVRRSSDNTEQDIGFIGCYLDTATLKTFVGSNSGYVVTWYDQANSNNATQSTSGNQPRIVNAGTVERVSGKVAIRFISSSNTGLIATVSGSETASSSFVVWQYTSSNDGGARVFSNREAGLSDYQKYIYVLQKGSDQTNTSSYFQSTGYQVDVSTSTNTLYLFNNFNRGTQILNSVNNGTETSYTFTTGTMTPVAYSIGVSAFSDGTLTDGNLDGYVLEIIHYNSDKTSDRTSINGQINSRYLIY